MNQNKNALAYAHNDKNGLLLGATRPLLVLATRILIVCGSEIKTVRRRVRFWVWCVALTSLAGIAYYFSSWYLQYIALYSPTFGITTPRYVLGNISPYVILIFQLGALILLLDSRQRQIRDRIEETLITKPVTNFEQLLGRVLGVSFLLWFIALLIVLVLHSIGLMCDMTGWQFAEPFQLHSMVNLLMLDAPVSFIVSCSVVVLLTNVLRLRMLVLIFGLALLSTWTFIVSKFPYSFLSIVSASSNDSLFISETLPQFASLSTIGTRIASLLFAGALLCAAALFVRIDGMSFKIKSAFIIALLGLSGVLYGSVTWGVVQHYYLEPGKWREVHQSYTMDGSMDILDITGSIRIDPKSSLSLDLELLVNTDTSETLTFTFNPSMNISNIYIDDEPAQYTFHQGLLKVEKGKSSNSGRTYHMRIVAKGVPKPRFGYLDSAINYLTDPDVPTRGVALLGKDASIYEKNYVALMAGGYWYPTPGPVGETVQSAHQGTDFFTLDLTIDLAAKNWLLVGPGTELKTSWSTGSSYRMKPEFAVSDINLFASQFACATMTVGGMTFSLYLHKKHASNMRFGDEDILRALRDEIERTQNRFAERGLSLPTRTLSLVETPDRLRTVGGGLRMKSLTELPEIGLLKESGFPTINVQRAFLHDLNRESFQSEEIWLVRLIVPFITYFNAALGTDNPLSGMTNRYWAHHTSASGDFAEILDEVMLALISPQETPFSIYSTLHVADLTQLMAPRISRGQSISFVLNALEQERYFGSRLNVWNQVERTGLKTPVNSEEYQQRLELVLLKARAIARGLLSLNDEESVIAWLLSIRNQFEGSTYTLSDLIETAESFNVQVEPFLTNWITESGAPAYVVSPLTVEQVANDELGNQQFQASVFVRNVQAVDGVIRLIYPTKTFADRDLWLDRTQTPGIQIQGNSAKRINITTPYELRQILIDPGLSLERAPFRIRADSTVVNQRQTTAPRPFLEASNWVPRTTEQIIVDDLDEGFSVAQPAAKATLFISLTPLTWFSSNVLRIFEEDKGILVHNGWGLDMPAEIWHRKLYAGSYGRHRKTTAIVWVPTAKPPNRVSFVANVPASATWVLEYHLPYGWQGSDHFAGTYHLAIRNAEGNWNTKFDTTSEDVTNGWNSVEKFDLNAGTVIVDVLGTESPGLMFADAIRWTKVVDASSTENIEH